MPLDLTPSFFFFSTALSDDYSHKSCLPWQNMSPRSYWSEPGSPRASQESPILLPSSLSLFFPRLSFTRSLWWVSLQWWSETLLLWCVGLFFDQSVCWWLLSDFLCCGEPRAWEQGMVLWSSWLNTGPGLVLAWAESKECGSQVLLDYT